MKTTLLKSLIAAAPVWTCLGLLCAQGWAQGTAFTYQGRLNDGAAPASGNYDLRFGIFDAVTNGNQAGLYVTNAATPVSNGLFTVVLDFGNQFGGAARWLEIAVRTNGAGAFTNLAPRQPLTATPYAITAGNVTGPINGASIVGGTIGSAQLAAGAVTAAAIASNSIGNVQLIHRYLSGSVTYASLAGAPYNFTPSTRDQPVTFSTPFMVPPVITLSINTLQSALPGKGPLLVTAFNTNGFTMRVTTMAVGAEVAHNGYSVARPTIRTVNGNPAVAGVAQVGLSTGIIYNRSTDTLGNWQTPTALLVPGLLGWLSLDIAGGNPAITYVDGAGGVSYLRANDVNGTNWPAPTQIVTQATLGGNALRYAGLMVNGNPALIAANINTNVFYLRADDTNGASWGSPMKVFSASNSVNAIAITMAGGRPAIAVCGDGRIYFARANDTNGTSWPAFITAVPPNQTNDVPLGNLSLMDLNSKLAIGFVGQAGVNSPNYTLFFAQSTDGTGSSWNTPQSLSTTSPGQISPTFNLIGGSPYVVYTRDGVLHLIESFPSGGSFIFPTAVDLEPGDGTCSIETVGGQTSMAFYGNSALRFIRQTSPPPNSTINWIAVEP